MCYILYFFLQFSDNGLIQLQSATENEQLLFPAPYPQGFRGNEGVAMLAVFWDDADLTLGEGKLLYQVTIQAEVLFGDKLSGNWMSRGLSHVELPL